MESVTKKYPRRYIGIGIGLMLCLATVAGCLKKPEQQANKLTGRKIKHTDLKLPAASGVEQKPQNTKNMLDTPLEDVPGWSADQVAKMKKSWLTTAEQVVALSATTGGIRSLAEQLGVSEEKGRQLVAAARSQIAPATRAEMEKGANADQRGLGVLPPRNRH